MRIVTHLLEVLFSCQGKTHQPNFGAVTPGAFLHRSHLWSADFMSDALCVGPDLGLFSMIDRFNREAVTIEIEKWSPVGEAYEGRKRA